MSPSELGGEPLIVVARVLKARGRRGEVAVQDLCDADEIFEPGRTLRLEQGENARDLKIEESWRHQGRLIVKFVGVETISDAEELKGWEARMPEGELPPAEEGEHYYFELIGCEVFENGTERAVGRVEAIQEPGGQIVLEVVSGKREVLIPYPLVVAIDVQAKRITTELPEGLEELNA